MLCTKEREEIIVDQLGIWTSNPLIPCPLPSCSAMPPVSIIPSVGIPCQLQLKKTFPHVVETICTLMLAFSLLWFCSFQFLRNIEEELNTVRLEEEHLIRKINFKNLGMELIMSLSNLSTHHQHLSLDCSCWYSSSLDSSKPKNPYMTVLCVCLCVCESAYLFFRCVML